MTTAEIVFSPPNQEDASDLASLTQKNWHYETIYPFLYPQCWEDPASGHSFILAYNDRALRNPKNEAVKATLEGKIIAAGRWTLVDPEDNGDEGQGKKLEPPKGSEEFRKATMEAAAKQFDEKMKGIKHFELTNINVLPGHQHHGLGTQLMNLCFARADEEGLPVYVMSLPSSKDFYLRFGFEVFDEFEFDLQEWGGEFRGFGKYKFYGMLRPAKK